MPALTASALAVLLGVSAPLLAQDGGAARVPSAAPAATPATASPRAIPVANLPPAPPAPRLSLADTVIRDGDIVAASGSVFVEPGRPVVFCPGVVVALRPSCPGGLPVFDVNLDLLTDPERFQDTRYGRTWLRGVFRGGGIAVTAQARPAPWVPGRLEPVKLCRPPRGGWGKSIDPTALFTYVGARPERFNGWSVAGAGPGRNVYTFGVSSGSLSAALRDLRAAFGPNICVVRAPQNAVAERRAKAALARLAESGGYSLHLISGGGFDPVLVEVGVLSQRLYDRLSAIGLDLLDVRVWLMPVRD